MLVGQNGPQITEAHFSVRRTSNIARCHQLASSHDNHTGKYNKNHKPPTYPLDQFLTLFLLVQPQLRDFHCATSYFGLRLQAILVRYFAYPTAKCIIEQLITGVESPGDVLPTSVFNEDSISELAVVQLCPCDERFSGNTRCIDDAILSSMITILGYDVELMMTGVSQTHSMLSKSVFDADSVSELAAGWLLL